jgi:serine/threonine protein phosphatase 1
MAHVNFDQFRDRLFSVGDLIDRGPDSLRCLELIAEPWFYTVQGNHEIAMLGFFLSYLIDGSLNDLEDIHDTGFLDYGGEWVVPYFQSENKCMSDEFNRGLARIVDLPLMLVVGENENRFHVCHAELVKPDLTGSDSAVWLDCDIDRWLAEASIPTEAQNNIYWGRALMHSKLVDQEQYKVQPGLSRTFCGHTYARKPRQALSHYCLDTGAFFSADANDNNTEYGLTLFDVQASRCFSKAYSKADVIETDCI